MSLLLPEIIVANTLNLALAALRDDYRNCVSSNQEERSMLYLLFSELSLGKYDLFENVKKLIVTTNQNPKHLEVKLGFDTNSGRAPVVYISLASESDRNNTIGIGQGDQPELKFNNEAPVADTFRSQFRRRFFTTYYLVIIAENRNEMMVLYNLFKAIMITCINHLTQEGLSNIKIGGQDIKLYDQVPDRIFSRAVVVNFEYDQIVPEFLLTNIYRKIRLYWKMADAEESQGPIEVYVNDESDSESDSDT